MEQLYLCQESSSPTPPRKWARRWLTAVYDVARTSGWHIVGEISHLTVGRSFYSIAISTDDDQLTVMLNPASLVVAAVAGHHPFPANATYVEVLGPERFSAAGFRKLSPAEPDAPLREPHLDGFEETEAMQIRYHRPGRVGDVLFNWFD